MTYGVWKVFKKMTDYTDMTQAEKDELNRILNAWLARERAAKMELSNLNFTVIGTIGTNLN